LPVSAGQQLAITLHAGSGAPTFSWLGDTQDHYPQGEDFERVIGNHNWVAISAPNNTDVGFRTFVQVPEPWGLSACVLGMGWTVRRRRR
jgi:hypothetical protein